MVRRVTAGSTDDQGKSTSLIIRATLARGTIGERGDPASATLNRVS
jgi:hypothetical protein